MASERSQLAASPLKKRRRAGANAQKRSQCPCRPRCGWPLLVLVLPNNRKGKCARAARRKFLFRARHWEFPFIRPAGGASQGRREGGGGQRRRRSACGRCPWPIARYTTVGPDCRSMTRSGCRESSNDAFVHFPRFLFEEMAAQKGEEEEVRGAHPPAESPLPLLALNRGDRGRRGPEQRRPLEKRGGEGEKRGRAAPGEQPPQRREKR